MKVSEMRTMPVEEAERHLREIRTELAKERAVAAGGTRPENPGKIRGLKKNIARLLTVINEKAGKGIHEPVQEEGLAKAGETKTGETRAVEGQRTVASEKHARPKTGKVAGRKGKARKRPGKKAGKKVKLKAKARKGLGKKLKKNAKKTGVKKA